MSRITWDSLLDEKDPETVAAWLKNADIGSVMFQSRSEEMKSILFECLEVNDRSSLVIVRVLELLQDCHVLLQGGITNDELKINFPILLKFLTQWISDSEVIINLLQLFSIVANKDCMISYCCKTNNNQLLQCVETALTFHNELHTVQRAGLKLFEEILKHTHLRYWPLISSRIFKSLLDNLVLNSADQIICFSCFSILAAVSDTILNLIRPWSEQLWDITFNVMESKPSSDMIAKCLIFLEKIVINSEGHSQLYCIAQHSNGLIILVDALGSLNAIHTNAVITTFTFIINCLRDEELVEELLPYASRKTDIVALSNQIKIKFKAFVCKMTQYDFGEENSNKVQVVSKKIRNLYQKTILILEYLFDPTSATASKNLNDSYSASHDDYGRDNKTEDSDQDRNEIDSLNDKVSKLTTALIASEKRLLDQKLISEKYERKVAELELAATETNLKLEAALKRISVLEPAL
eukprot:gene10738-14423_t